MSLSLVSEAIGLTNIRRSMHGSVCHREIYGCSRLFSAEPRAFTIVRRGEFADLELHGSEVGALMLPPLTHLLRRGPRHFSISQPPTLTAKHSIYVSQSTDPYFNLSFEDWYASTLGIYFAVSGWNITSVAGCRLFKEKPIQEPLLLIYRDEPCVVIGRNQNPWKEVNFPALRRANIPFIRRRSGGGTVYHVTSSCV